MDPRLTIFQSSCLPKPTATRSTLSVWHGLRSCTRRLRRNEITDFVVEWCAEPYPPLRIRDKFAHTVARKRKRELDNRTRLWIQAPEHIVVVRAVPDKVIAIDSDCIGRRVRVW